jgi:tetratricopeptide (TPR) repeat protein
MQRNFVSVIVLLLAFASAAIAAPTPDELLSAGRADEALRDLQQRVAVNANDAAAHNLLCRTYFALEDWAPAVRACERSVELQPNSSLFQMWLGRAYGRRAEHAGALSAYSIARKSLEAMDRAVKLDPSNTEARRDLAEYLATAPGIVGGDRNRALRLADEVAGRDLATASWIRAMVAGSQGNQDEAERQHKVAIQASGNSSTTLLELAHLYRKQKRWSEFETLIDRATTGRPKGSDLFDAAELLVNSGRNLNGAIHLLQRYLAGPTDEAAPAFRAHLLMGQAYQKVGDRSAAEQQYRAALALAGNYRPAQDALRRLGVTA